ncbi:hypothetical protein [Kushneria aurantia]|uniref:N-acetyltransferase domain-containing protein n=1 Tax=Kushneria aurantia TaxID=504092 RepID=A0ABV6G1P0_9GAMM|nr:hypothetical protein [Kushneria aurantia]
MGHQMLPALCGDEGEQDSGVPGLFLLQLQPLDDDDYSPLLLVECREYRTVEEAEVVQASLTFHYRVHSPESSQEPPTEGEFSASYCCHHHCGKPAVRLTSSDIDSSGYCVVDPDWVAGRGVGTFFMNEIVQWVQQWPNATVMPVLLDRLDALGSGARRRNRFYEQFGLRFEVRRPQGREAASAPISAGELKPLSDRAAERLATQVTRLELEAYLSHQVDQQARMAAQIRELRSQLKAHDESHERANASPLRWALAILWSRLWYGN